MNLGTLIFSAIVGWCCAGLCNWMADVLPHWWSQPTHRTLPTPATWPHYWTLWWQPWRQTACPHCGQPRPWRVPLLEIALSLLFVLAAYYFSGDWLRLGAIWLYSAFLLTVLVIDYEQRRVLNLMLFSAYPAVLALSFVLGTPTPLNALLGGGVGLAFFIVIALLSRGAMGAGDVKLAGLIGLMTGYPDVWRALIIGILLAGVAGILLLVSRRAGRKSYMAYAPYLALGALWVTWQL